MKEKTKLQLAGKGNSFFAEKGSWIRAIEEYVIYFAHDEGADVIKYSTNDSARFSIIMKGNCVRKVLFCDSARADDMVRKVKGVWWIVCLIEKSGDMLNIIIDNRQEKASSLVMESFTLPTDTMQSVIMKTMGILLSKVEGITADEITGMLEMANEIEKRGEYDEE